MKTTVVFATEVCVGDIAIPIVCRSIRDLENAVKTLTPSHALDLSKVTLVHLTELALLGELIPAQQPA